MGGLIPLNGISFFGSDSVEFYSFREELRDHPGSCGEKPGGSVSSWTRPHNRVPSSSISPTLVPLTLSSSIRFTAFPVRCQFAGSGNSAILRNISANCTRVRCPSASISQ
jgi:hypothetical protein